MVLSPMAYHPQILDEGYTRLEISSPPDRLKIAHQTLVNTSNGPFKVRYVQIFKSQWSSFQTKSFVGIEISQARLLQAT